MIRPILSFVAIGLLLAQPAQAEGEGKGKKIAFLQTLATHPYVVATTKSFRARAEAHGMEITFLTAMLDAGLQAQQIDDAIARRFDLVVVVPTSEQAVVPALARAKAAGVPVVLVNNTPKDGTEDLYLTFVGQDQTEMGRLAGDSLLNALKESGREGGKVALITGALQQGVGPRRVAGFREAVKKNPKLEIVAVEDARWDTAVSERIAGQLYARFAAGGGLDAVYGMADNQAVAAIRAAEAANITVGDKPKQLVIVGGNCLKEGMDNLKTGKMHSTVTQLPNELGILAADVVNDYFAKKQLPKNVLQPLETITKANVTKWEASCTY
ncbi:MAG TPA: sugar ABC transporter substrate-binding protein [Xanthobacteraceae bacterium]|jgi:ABC-type sugar transport system substrate-binding protein